MFLFCFVSAGCVSDSVFVDAIAFDRSWSLLKVNSELLPARTREASGCGARRCNMRKLPMRISAGGSKQLVSDTVLFTDYRLISRIMLFWVLPQLFSLIFFYSGFYSPPCMLYVVFLYRNSLVTVLFASCCLWISSSI